MLIKENFSRDMVEMLAADLRSSFQALFRERTEGVQPPRARRRRHC
jgi:hypothetical protein